MFIYAANRLHDGLYKARRAPIAPTAKPAAAGIDFSFDPPFVLTTLVDPPEVVAVAVAAAPVPVVLVVVFVAVPP